MKRYGKIWKIFFLNWKIWKKYKKDMKIWKNMKKCGKISIEKRGKKSFKAKLTNKKTYEK